MIDGVAGWLGWCSTRERAQAAAVLAEDQGVEGIVLHRGETEAVVRVLGGDDRLAEALRAACDVALYRTATRHALRHVRTWPTNSPTPGVTMLFSIHRRPGMERTDFHRWWQQSHTPIALRHHVGMWDYAQVSVVETLHGEPWDGFAVTQWPTLDDLMHRFSSGPEGTDALRHDAAQFTDPATLRRHLLDEVVVADTPWPPVGDMPVGLARSVDAPEGFDVEVSGLPRGVNADVRLAADGRARLDVLWRTTVRVCEVDEVLSRFDELWGRIATPVAGARPPRP